MDAVRLADRVDGLHAEVVLAEGLQVAHVEVHAGRLGPNSIEKNWPEFRLERSLEFWLEIPYTKKLLKNG